MYVDDGALIEPTISASSAQTLINHIFELMGTPLSEDKRSLMSTQDDFIGVVHDFKDVPTTGKVSCTPRPALLTKALAMLQSFLDRNSCTPAEASKFRGVQGFLNLALFGQLSKAGARPFKERQYLNVAPWTLSHTMRRAIEFYQAIFACCPKRTVLLQDRHSPPVIIASDAQVEPGTYPGGGYLVYDAASGKRYGAWCQFRDEELSILATSMQIIAEGGQPIAKCELAMLPILLYHEKHNLVDRDVVWLVDNTAALGGVIKGASGLAVSEQLIATFWIMAFALGIRLWIEYIDSKGNWSDGISRDFGKDLYSAEHNFVTRPLSNPLAWFNSDIGTSWKNALTLRGKIFEAQA
jgi:hypothetical protein